MQMLGVGGGVPAGGGGQSQAVQRHTAPAAANLLPAAVKSTIEPPDGFLMTLSPTIFSAKNNRGHIVP